MMTEQDAKTKWCPFARALYTDNNSYAGSSNRNPDGGITGADRCIGSACAVWQWVLAADRFRSSIPRDGWEHQSAEDSGEGRDMWLEPEAEWKARRTGYCGRAQRRTG